MEFSARKEQNLNTVPLYSNSYNESSPTYSVKFLYILN